MSKPNEHLHQTIVFGFSKATSLSKIQEKKAWENDLPFPTGHMALWCNLHSPCDRAGIWSPLAQTPSAERNNSVPKEGVCWCSHLHLKKLYDHPSVWRRGAAAAPGEQHSWEPGSAATSATRTELVLSKARRREHFDVDIENLVPPNSLQDNRLNKRNQAVNSTPCESGRNSHT